jgi:hypothetical protein
MGVDADACIASALDRHWGSSGSAWAWLRSREIATAELRGRRLGLAQFLPFLLQLAQACVDRGLAGAWCEQSLSIGVQLSLDLPQLAHAGTGSKQDLSQVALAAQDRRPARHQLSVREAKPRQKRLAIHAPEHRLQP